MSKNVTVGPDKFEVVLSAWLEEPVDYIVDQLEPNMRKACRQARKTARNLSPENPSIHLTKGSYKSGWSYKVKRPNKLVVYGRIYNRKYPGLVHLLEKGHLTNGGFSRAKPIEHVKPARDEAADILEKLMEDAMGDAFE